MSDSVLKSVTFTEPEYNLVFNLLQDHLEEIMEDEFFHVNDHDAATRAETLTVEALRSMKRFNPDLTAEECFADGSSLGLTA